MNVLNDVERHIIVHLLSGKCDWVVALRNQLSFVSVIDRDINSAGQMTYVSRVSCMSAEIPASARLPLQAKISYPELVHGGAFVLWTDGGRLSCLEGFSYLDHDWPQSFDINKLVLEIV